MDNENPKNFNNPENSSAVSDVYNEKSEENIENNIIIYENHKNEDSLQAEILNEVEKCGAIFQSQQVGDPELTTADKRKIAEELLHQKPGRFLMKFGEYLKENHLNYFLVKFSSSYEVQFYVKNFKKLLNDHNRNLIKRNRRYEAMKRMEAEGNYFSETEMEKRQPLLYHQMVGQYLSEKEKLMKRRQAQESVIPSFSNFLLYKMEREEMNQLVKFQQEEEDKLGEVGTSSEEDTGPEEHQKRWGEDWEEETSRKKIKKKQPKMHKPVSKKEKHLLLQEFQSIMKNNFLNGKDTNFNYSEVDLNPDYDSIDLRTQDEEEKYFDEETNDAAICTDTGIEDY